MNALSQELVQRDRPTTTGGFAMTSTFVVSATATGCLLRVVCAWCTRRLQEGDAPTPVSHGVCRECAKNLFTQASPGRIA